MAVTIVILWLQIISAENNQCFSLPHFAPVLTNHVAQDTSAKFINFVLAYNEVLICLIVQKLPDKSVKLFHKSYSVKAKAGAGAIHVCERFKVCIITVY